MITWGDTWLMIKKDFRIYGGKSFFSKLMVYYFSAPFRLLLNYRLGRYFYNHRSSMFRQVSKYLKYQQLTKRNCDISYNAVIGENVKFLHPLSVIVGDRVIIRDNVRIWQSVTLGSHGKSTEDSKYPVIEKDVKIFAGAVIAGSVQVGEAAVIGANSVVLSNVPPFSVAVGSPAKIVNK
jgi:serine O-acetyltransferase